MVRTFYFMLVAPLLTCSLFILNNKIRHLELMNK